MDIRPLPAQHGVGFFSLEQQPQMAGKHIEKNVGRYWNYLFTPHDFYWPESYSKKTYTIDGFSPNLNKSLHVGHLRQLALAKGLKILLGYGSEFVALLGASQGAYSFAINELDEWFSFLNYHPKLYYDVLMPRDLVSHHKDGQSEVEVWDDNEKVIVIRSDGRPTYAFPDIAFTKIAHPDYYITGVEQKEHFQSLGLEDKHLPMGLVLGSDNKKLKSRDGSEEAKAKAVMEEVMANLDDSCPEKRKLAWNILAWNFLSVSRQNNAKYNAEEWTNPDMPGLYITYTYARIKKALKGIDSNLTPDNMKSLQYREGGGMVDNHWSDEEVMTKWSIEHPDPQYDMTQEDVNLVGFSEYHRYYWMRSIELMDPNPIAIYAHDLARLLGKAYHQEKIQGGRYGFQYAVKTANYVLRKCMWAVGMFPLEQV